MPTILPAVAEVKEVEQALTWILSILRPLVDTGTTSTMFAAASDAVTVGALVVQAVCGQQLIGFNSIINLIFVILF